MIVHLYVDVCEWVCIWMPVRVMSGYFSVCVSLSVCLYVFFYLCDCVSVSLCVCNVFVDVYVSLCPYV